MRCYKGYPELNAGLRISNVRALDCPPLAADSTQGSTTHALLTILIMLTAVLLAVVIYVNRERVKSNVRPLVNNFQRSMQYRTIEKAFNDSDVIVQPPGARPTTISTSIPPEVNV